MALSIKPVHPRFGAEVGGIDLTSVDAERDFPEIRRLFDEHSFLLFRNQDLDDDSHMRLAEMFGPLENRPAMAGEDTPFSVPAVSNVKEDGGVTDEFDMHTLNLKANMLWHTDSTFLPIPSLVNLLTAKVVPTSGGQTELCSTRAAFEDMPPERQEELRKTVIWHRYNHSRAKISPELAKAQLFNHWPDRPWRAVWTNPATGREAVYVASHAFAVEGMTPPVGKAFIDALVEECTRPEYIYSHTWQVGDVILFDERATMHRGQPWPYDQPRTLKSICCTAQDSDGLDTVRVVSAS